MTRWSWVALSAACAEPEPEGEADAGALTLVWVQGDAQDDWARSRAGLWWQLSLLGASPPADEAALDLLEEDGDRARLRLDLSRAGFGEAALAAMVEATEGLAQSDEVAVFGGLDLGRLLMRTLYSPWRYYAVTGACGTLADWERSRARAPSAEFVVNDSLLVAGERLIRLAPDPADWREVAFLAAEGEGSLADGSFEAAEHETLDLMSNGQQRFAVYDVDGRLLPAATTTAAGQPGRCMWCHEGQMQVLSPGNTAVEGYLSPEAFQAQLDLADLALEGRRAALESAVDWSEPEVHAWGERLVESFLSPSADRLAREWGVEADEIAGELARRGLSVHQSDEYPEQGDLYARAEIDEALEALLPWIAARSSRDLGDVDSFRSVPVLDSARELAPEDFDALDGAELAETLAPCEGPE